MQPALHSDDARRARGTLLHARSSRNLRRVAAVALIAVSLATCGSETETVEGPADEVGPAAMAAALAQLVSVQQLPFNEYLVQTRIDPAAGSPTSSGPPGRPLTDAERDAIEEAVSSSGPVRWIEDPAEWRTADLRPSVEGAAILGVGEPTIDGKDSALVPVSFWCGGTCGLWLSYRVRAQGDTWLVTGTEGAIAES